MPRLSVITINYNNLAGLQKTMQSVLMQSFTDFEYVVIDGGSNDGSAEYIKSQEKHLKYWVSEKDNGIFNAHNKGLEKATGEYCLFLNSGDVLCGKDVFSKVFQSQRSEDVLYGNMLLDFGNGKTKQAKMLDLIDAYQMYKDTLWHPVSFIKRNLFEKFGNYDESFKLSADHEFFFRTIVANKASTLHLGFNISVFNMDGESSSKENVERLKVEKERVFAKYLSAEERDILEAKLQKEIAKKSTLLFRIINKIKEVL
jgi:glycosyltransferase involved in cell wall biosynthesis